MLKVKKVKNQEQIKQRFKLVDFIQNRQKKGQGREWEFLGYGNWNP